MWLGHVDAVAGADTSRQPTGGADTSRQPPAGGPWKTAIVFWGVGSEAPGWLVGCLSEFAGREVNLTRIESRPTKDRMGDYCFSIDCEGHIDDERVGDALAALHRVCADVRYLGSYPRRNGEQESVPDGRHDADFAAARDWLARVRETGAS